jgi:hypothetical protein
MEQLKELVRIDSIIVVGLVIVAIVMALRGDQRIAETVVAGLLGYIGRSRQ